MCCWIACLSWYILALVLLIFIWHSDEGSCSEAHCNFRPTNGRYQQNLYCACLLHMETCIQTHISRLWYIYIWTILPNCDVWGMICWVGFDWWRPTQNLWVWHIATGLRTRRGVSGCARSHRHPPQTHHVSVDVSMADMDFISAYTLAWTGMWQWRCMSTSPLLSMTALLHWDLSLTPDRKLLERRRASCSKTLSWCSGGVWFHSSWERWIIINPWAWTNIYKHCTDGKK